MRILLVEDESIIAADVKKTLEGLGFEVIGPEATGEGAVERAVTDSPRLVIMDITLRGRMDGIEAAARIRSELDIPVLYMSSHTDAETFERARQTGPAGFLVKPVEEGELCDAIETALFRNALQEKLKEAREKCQALLDNAGRIDLT